MGAPLPIERIASAGPDHRPEPQRQQPLKLCGVAKIGAHQVARLVHHAGCEHRADAGIARSLDVGDYIVAEMNYLTLGDPKFECDTPPNAAGVLPLLQLRRDENPGRTGHPGLEQHPAHLLGAVVGVTDENGGMTAPYQSVDQRDQLDPRRLIVQVPFKLQHLAFKRRQRAEYAVVVESLVNLRQRNVTDKASDAPQLELRSVADSDEITGRQGAAFAPQPSSDSPLSNLLVQAFAKEDRVEDVEGRDGSTPRRSLHLPRPDMALLGHDVVAVQAVNVAPGLVKGDLATVPSRHHRQRALQGVLDRAVDLALFRGESRHRSSRRSAPRRRRSA